MKIRLHVDSRDYHAYQQFGQSTTVELDEALSFDDPSIPERIQPTGNVECTCYTVEYIAQNKTKVAYDIDELFARIPHTAFGASPQDVLGEIIKNGLKRVDNGQYEKPFSSYWRADTGMFDAFDNVRSSIKFAESPVAIWTNWYDNWTGLGAGAIIPIGHNVTSGHMYAGKGWGSVKAGQLNGVPMLIIEWWGGYTMYMPRETFNDAVSRLGCGTAILSTVQINEKRQKTVMEAIIDILKNIILLVKQQKQQIMQPQDQPVVPVPPVKTNSEKLYDLGYSLLGTHCTLDDSIPKELGCAQAVSYVLSRLDVPLNVPRGGISGTGELIKWLRASPWFDEVPDYAVGRIIINPSGESKIGYPHGHVGICGKRSIMSNESSTGKWMANYTMASWANLFVIKRGFPTHYFQLRDTAK